MGMLPGLALVCEKLIRFAEPCLPVQYSRAQVADREARGEMQITAAVVAERSAPFVIDTLELADPRPDEVLVRIVASGMCHTDLHGRDGYFPTMPYPAVFGHEGAGVVDAVGIGGAQGRAGRSCHHLVPLVRHLSKLPPAHAGALPAGIQAENERHAAGRHRR